MLGFEKCNTYLTVRELERELGAGRALNAGACLFASASSRFALFFKESSLIASRLSLAWFTGVMPARLCASRTPVTGFQRFATCDEF